jgi:hypothetical protein
VFRWTSCFKGLKNTVVLYIASCVQFWNVRLECLKVCVSPHCNFMEEGVTVLELGLSHWQKRVFKEMVLTRSGYKRLSKEMWEQDGEDCVIRSFITCTVHQIITSLMKSRRIRWARYVACIRVMRRLFSMLSEDCEGKRSFGRPRQRRQGNIEGYRLDGEDVVECYLVQAVVKCRVHDHHK